MDVIEKKGPEFQHPAHSPEAVESVELTQETAEARGIENQGLAGFQAMEMPKPVLGGTAPVEVPAQPMVREMNPAVALENLNKVLRGDLSVTAGNASEMMDAANQLGGSEQAQLQ